MEKSLIYDILLINLIRFKNSKVCRSGGMVYTCDSKSHASRLVGSSPTFGTNLKE